MGVGLTDWIFQAELGTMAFTGVYLGFRPRRPSHLTHVAARWFTMESAGHIARAQACGGDWYRTRTNLGNGMTGRVNAATTQCGAPFVAKGALPTTDKDRGGAAVHGDCFRMLALWSCRRAVGANCCAVNAAWSHRKHSQSQCSHVLRELLKGRAKSVVHACVQ